MNKSLVAAGAVIALAAWVAVSTADATLMMHALGRCGARYQFGDGLDDDPANWCPEKDTCARHQAFIKWDAECGIPDYQ